jgi:hypothetical protein
MRTVELESRRWLLPQQIVAWLGFINSQGCRNAVLQGSRHKRTLKEWEEVNEDH